MADHKDTVRKSVETNSDEIFALSHKVHGLHEIAFHETKSAECVAHVLERNGFAVERGVGNLPTAFTARVGSGDLHIGICAEYDALSGIGHACGHNIIAAAAVGAGVALCSVVDELNLTITVFGTPAEEGGGGKVFMLQQGVFDGVNAAMMVHPSSIERDAMRTLAISTLEVEYRGVSAHAAAAPERGKSASAALTLAHAGVGLLREHFETGDRVHGIVVHGGDASNVVPDKTRDTWLVRARDAERLRALEAKVLDVFRGAALATGCSLAVHHSGPDYANVKTDKAMAEMWRANAQAFGRNSIRPLDTDGSASTDMGNVSYAVPTIHPLIAIESNGANIHETEFAEFAVEPTGDRAAVEGAAMMAMTVVDMASDTAMRQRLTSKSYSQASEGNAVYLSRDWQKQVAFDPASNVDR